MGIICLSAHGLGPILACSLAPASQGVRPRWGGLFPGQSETVVGTVVDQGAFCQNISPDESMVAALIQQAALNRRYRIQNQRSVTLPSRGDDDRQVGLRSHVDTVPSRRRDHRLESVWLQSQTCRNRRVNARRSGPGVDESSTQNRIRYRLTGVLESSEARGTDVENDVRENRPLSSSEIPGDGRQRSGSPSRKRSWRHQT